MLVASDRSDKSVYNVFLVMYSRNYKPLNWNFGWMLYLFFFKQKLLKDPICNFFESFNPALAWDS